MIARNHSHINLGVFLFGFDCFVRVTILEQADWYIDLWPQFINQAESTQIIEVALELFTEQSLLFFFLSL